MAKSNTATKATVTPITIAITNGATLKQSVVTTDTKAFKRKLSTVKKQKQVVREVTLAALRFWESTDPRDSGQLALVVDAIATDERGEKDYKQAGNVVAFIKAATGLNSKVNEKGNFVFKAGKKTRADVDWEYCYKTDIATLSEHGVKADNKPAPFDPAKLVSGLCSRLVKSANNGKMSAEQQVAAIAELEKALETVKGLHCDGLNDAAK